MRRGGPGGRRPGRARSAPTWPTPTPPPGSSRRPAEAFGHVDVLVANHARSGAQNLEQLTADELDRCHAVNTRGSLLLAQAFAAQHDGRPGGRILFFTSGQYHGAMPDELPYIASKGALHQLTAQRGRTSHAPRHHGQLREPRPERHRVRRRRAAGGRRRANPGRRWGTPADTARLVAWLVSDEAGWVTGQVIASDGGWSARG